MPSVRRVLSSAPLGSGLELSDHLVDHVSGARGRQDDHALRRRRPRPNTDEKPGEHQPKRPKSTVQTMTVVRHTG